MIHDIVTRLAEVLAGTPSSVLPLARIATRQPAAVADLPAVSISIAADRGDELGFGRLLRAGELLPPDGARMRQDTLGDRLAGTVTFDVWAAASAQTEQVSRAIDDKLRAARPVLRERGFAWLRPTALEAMENLEQDPGGGNAFAAWRQRLAYRFAYEGVEGGIVDSSGVIRRVDVDVVEAQESFSVPEPTEG